MLRSSFTTLVTKASSSSVAAFATASSSPTLASPTSSSSSSLTSSSSSPSSFPTYLSFILSSASSSSSSTSGATLTSQLAFYQCFPPGYFISASFICLSLALVTLNVTVIVGNLIVIVGVKTAVKFRSAVTRVFIISLAVADLCLGVLVLPISITNELLDKHWPFGKILCSIWLAVDVWICTASILNLLVIGLDRFLVICRALHYPNLITNFRARLLVLAAWLFSFVICIPTALQILLFNDTIPIWSVNQTLTKSLEAAEHDDTGKAGSNRTSLCPRWMVENRTCNVNNSTLAIKFYSAMGSFFIPTLFLVYFYFMIFLKVYRNAQVLRSGILRLDEKSTRHRPFWRHLKSVKEDSLSATMKVRPTNSAGFRVHLGGCCSEGGTGVGPLVGHNSNHPSFSINREEDRSGIMPKRYTELSSGQGETFSYRDEIGKVNGSELCFDLDYTRNEELTLASRSMDLCHNEPMEVSINIAQLQTKATSHIRHKVTRQPLQRLINHRRLARMQLLHKRKPASLRDSPDSCSPHQTVAFAPNEAIIGPKEHHSVYDFIESRRDSNFNCPIVKRGSIQGMKSVRHQMERMTNPLGHLLRLGLLPCSLPERSQHEYIFEVNCNTSSSPYSSAFGHSTPSTLSLHNSTCALAATTTTTCSSAYLSAYSSNSRINRELKAVRLLGIVCGTFIICWMPFFTVFLVGAFLPYDKVPSLLYDIFFWLGYNNSAMNPIIYALVSRELRGIFKRLLGFGRQSCLSGLFGAPVR